MLQRVRQRQAHWRDHDDFVRPQLPQIDDGLKKVFVDDKGSVWVGYNVSQLPERRRSAFGTLAEAMVPRYYNEQFPYLCATLVPCALSGDFLEIFRRFDVMPFDGQYVLSVDQVDRWGMYECYTFKLCQCLVNHVMTPLNFALPILPRKIGYCELERTEYHVISRAKRARRAFCLLFGMASYLIALVPNWKAVAKGAGLSEDWLDGLEKSPIADFSIKEGRVGAFIDLADSSAELQNLPRLVRHRIPFWIFWGDGTTYHPPLEQKREVRIAELFRPSGEQIRLAKEESRLMSFFTKGLPGNLTLWDCDYGLPRAASGGALPKNPSVPPSLEKPKVPHSASSLVGASVPPIDPYAGYVSFEPGQVEKGSRQLPFESPEEFWTRQHADDEEKLCKMPESERKRLRNDRDGYHVTRKSIVYHWEKFSWGYVRRRVSKKEYDDYSKYSLAQMRFSVTRNEWDVCSDFGADENCYDDYSAYPDQEGSDDWEFPKVRGVAKEIESTQPPSQDNQTGGVSSEPLADEEGEILESDHIPVHPDGPVPDELALIAKRFQEAVKGRYTIRSGIRVREFADVALDRMIYYRYGLQLRDARSLTGHEENEEPEASAERDWATTRGIFYDAESAIENFTIQEMVGITQFVRRLLENAPIPPTALDIHPQNFSSPFAKAMQSIACSFHVRKCTLDQVVYLLHSDDLRFAVALEDASLVVEVLRRGVDPSRKAHFDASSLIQLFSHRGSPFRRLFFVREPSMELEPLSWDLGYRSLDEEPGAYAYSQYEKLLELFMRHPRSRSAFGIGGPVWRAIRETHEVDGILEGPSDDTRLFGRSLIVPREGVFLEDALTESELRLLCGTYKVKKGTFSVLFCNALIESLPGNDIMYYSWWPSPRQWEAATSNVRYWSPGNERWFMSRLHDIRNGRATWVHVQKWPARLKTNKKTKRLMEKNRAFCEAFLDHILVTDPI